MSLFSFLTSPYIPGLVLVAVLVHRIHHLVVPRRAPSRLVRVVLRLPSLFLLVRALFFWSSWRHRDTASLCWLTFCTVSVALSVDALAHALDGTSVAPFNLLGYAFLLHVYASFRLDSHTVFTIVLPLLQLTISHVLALVQPWSHLRLIPSACASVLALVHFHAVLWFSDATYPLLNYVPCVYESILVALISLALFLNAFTQLVTEGTLSRPLFGHLLPRLDEDFSVALLRIATASLESSNLTGLGNELAPIPLSSVQLTRIAVSHTTKGFANEIKNVSAPVNDNNFWLNPAWYRACVSFAIGLLRFFIRSPAPDTPDQSEHADVYDKFIRGEQLSDDEYDAYAPSRSDSLDSLSSISENDQADTIGLYADLLDSTSTSHLLAHLAHHSTPLTRQRFDQLMAAQDGWIQVIHARKSATVSKDDARRNCVICTVEPRQIICWPCRCLALCDDCRENLASRASVSMHTCPCCRTSVQGYSKIYIP